MSFSSSFFFFPPSPRFPYWSRPTLLNLLPQHFFPKSRQRGTPPPPHALPAALPSGRSAPLSAPPSTLPPAPRHDLPRQPRPPRPAPLTVPQLVLDGEQRQLPFLRRPRGSLHVFTGGRSPASAAPRVCERGGGGTSPGLRRILFSRGAPGERSHAGALEAGARLFSTPPWRKRGGGGGGRGERGKPTTPPNNKQLLKYREAHARRLPSPGPQSQPMSLRLPSPFALAALPAQQQGAEPSRAQRGPAGIG